MLIGSISLLVPLLSVLPKNLLCSALAMNTLPLDEIALTATSYASANGLQVEKKQEDGGSFFQCAPISLLPNAFPRSAFEQAVEVAPAFNLLVDRISRDPEFLQETLQGVVKADPYTAKLLELYKKIYIDDPNNPAHSADRLGIQRSDYMLHNGLVKQVELNTIASSFGGLASKVASLHRFLVSRFDASELLAENKAVVTGNTSGLEPTDGVPENPTLERLPKAMQKARTSYEENFSVNDTVILFVVQAGESNTVDQRMLEFQLWEEYRIPVIRKSLTALHKEASVVDGILTVNGQEVALVYFRAGYAPTDYPDGYDGIEWEARATIEATRATKCPSLGYHLAGTKKVQQQLARPASLEKFFQSEPENYENMRKAFAGLYSLGNDATEEDYHAIKAVLDGHQREYVLKPQREGGGYNFYGDKLRERLEGNVDRAEDGSLKLSETLGEYILMERLFPPVQKAILLRAGKIEGTGDTISEFGCFGTILCSSKGAVKHNEYAGFLLRTKFSNVDEGGVASGFATLSSPFLC